MSQRPYPQYPQPPVPPPQRTGSPRTGSYPQSPYPQSPHFQAPRPQHEYNKGGGTQPYSTNGHPQYSAAVPSNISLPNQVFSSPYYGSQSNGSSPNHNFSSSGPFTPHPPPTSYAPQYDGSQPHPQTPQTAPHQDSPQSRGGPMGPPSRPNDKPTDINDLGDVLAGSGVDLREEEAAMFRVSSSDRQYGTNHVNGAANGVPVPYPFSRDNHYSPYVAGDRQSFYGAGFYNQPAASYKSIEASAEENKQRKIREKAEIKQYHLNDPFLLAGSLRKKMLAEINKSHVKFDDSLMFLPKSPPDPPQKRTFYGPDGHSVERRIYNQAILQHDSTLVEILSLLSLATQDRMRMLVEDAATTARGRRVGALGVAPPELDEPAPIVKESNPTSPFTAGNNAASSKPNPLKRSYSEMNGSADLLTVIDDLPSNPIVQALQQTMKQDTQDEEKRIAKRNNRKAKKAAAEGQASDGSAAPSVSGEVAPSNIDTKKVVKKGKAAENISQAQQLNALNNTTQMALGGKKMPSWMSGASKGPSNPYLARPNANTKKEPSSNASSQGASTTMKRSFGDFREDREGGKGIQLRDLIMVLEQNAKGMEKRSLQKAYGLQGTSSNPK